MTQTRGGCAVFARPGDWRVSSSACRQVKQKKITLTRRAFDRALRSLPITLHYRIWQPSAPTQAAQER